MSDIATLGLAVDSRPVTAATKELDKLSASAKIAEQAAANLGKTAAPASGAIQAAARRAGISVDDFRARMATASESVNKQFPLVGKSAVDAAKNIQTLSGATADLGEKSEKSNARNLNLVNTLTRRFIIGYAISQVKALVTAIAGLNAEIARAGDLSKLTGFGNANTQGILSAAGNKGITNDTMAGALTAFNQQIPLAEAGVGHLAELLRANKITVSDTSDAFFKVADLVKNAANDTARLSILQQAGLPATSAMARLMSQGADAIKDQANNALKLGNQQIEAAQRIRDKWDENWQRFKDGGTFAISWVIEKMQQLGRAGDQAMQALNPKMLDVRINNAIADVNDFGQTAVAPDLQAGLRSRARTLVAQPPTTRDAAYLRTVAQDEISKAQMQIGLIGQTRTAASIAAERVAKSANTEKKPANDRHERLLQQAA